MSTSAHPAAAAPRAPTGHRVALACSDPAARDAASAFLSQLGLEPILVPDGSGSGVAALDRLDGIRGADFAILLLPGEGFSAPQRLLELGFVMGAVGRSRVCFLMAGKPALGPELDGVPRHPLDDAGLWRLLLAREMRQAGLEVDMNRAV